MRKKILIGAILLAASIAAIVTTLSRRAAATFPQIHSTFNMDEARAFRGYPLYNLGDSFKGLPLVAVLKDSNGVSFIYGVCDNVNGEACAPPLQVQVWPACKRNPGLYIKAGERGLPYSTDTLRGAPVSYFENGTRLELQTDKATVVIFSRSHATSVGAGQALRGVNLAVPAGATFPAPVPGAFSGGLSC